MQEKKDKFFNKIVKKNYNDELELILEHKNLSETAKNFLLNIFYKVEASYKDYEFVKHNVLPKKDYVQKLLNIINNQINEVIILSPNSLEAEMLQGKTFSIDKKQKKIVCLPIERKLLYAIAKISKKDRIVNSKYYIISKTMTDLINVGNNINMVEPIRDFNGYSWTTISNEIESIEHNTIYQNLRMLVGYKFLDDWVTNREYIADYIQILAEKLQSFYGAKNQKDIMECLFNLSILIFAKYNKDELKSLRRDKLEIDRNVNRIKNKEVFINNVTKRKKEIAAKIMRIDNIINDKNLLAREYRNRNEKLPLDKKIFSMRVLSDMMIREREKEFEKLNKYNELLKPRNFVQYKKDLEDKQKYLSLLDVKDAEKEIYSNIIRLQKSFIDCFSKKIDKIVEKEDLRNLIYEYRYYYTLMITREKQVNQEEVLQNDLNKLMKKLISKANSLKITESYTNLEIIERKIYENIFKVRIMEIEDLYIKITKEKEGYFMQLFDESAFEEKIKLAELNEVDNKNIEIKLNKKIKVFN